MAFNADAFRAAHQPWSFTVGGRRHVARPVSVPAVMRYFEQLAAAGKFRARERVARRLLRAAFPWRLSYLVYGDPVREFFRLNPGERRAALQDFFVSQGVDLTNPLLSTIGIVSPPKTPARTT